MSIGPHKVATLADRAMVNLLFALLLAATLCDPAGAVPLPRPRPERAPPAPQPQASQAEEPAAPSACRLRLTAEFAVAPSLPALDGPGECGVDDAVRLEAVVLRDKTRVALTPPAVVRCTFAEAIANWVRDDVAPSIRALGAPLRSLDNYDAYDCRGRNRVVGAKLSEHGKGNALDVRSFKLANGTVVELTDPQVSKDYRLGLRKATCGRFTTVLGPGSDGYHENHVHMDLAERAGGHRMCQWDVRDPEEEAAAQAATHVPLPPPRPASAGP